MRLFPSNQREGSGEPANRRGLLFPPSPLSALRWPLRKLRGLLGLPEERQRRRGDQLFRGGALLFALLVLMLGVAILAVLVGASADAWRSRGIDLLAGHIWDTGPGGVLGALPLIEGTLATSAIAMLIAVPVSLGIAVFLSELAPPWLREPVGVVVELLAAIPSVVYGLWGFWYLAPFLKANVVPGLQERWGWTGLFAGKAEQLNVLVAGVLLAIMIIPTISSLSREVLRAVPVSQREAAFALGATRWEVVRRSVLPYGKPGLFAAAILGLARAIGETMAVVMVIGNSGLMFSSLLSTGSTIPSTIANNWGEASGLQLSALFALGLILFLLSLAINLGARLIMHRGLQAGGSLRA